MPEIATAHKGMAIQRRCLLVLCIIFTYYLHPTQPILPAEKEIFDRFSYHSISSKLPYFKPIYDFSVKKIERFPALFSQQYHPLIIILFLEKPPIFSVIHPYYQHNFPLFFSNQSSLSAIYLFPGTNLITSIAVYHTQPP